VAINKIIMKKVGLIFLIFITACKVPSIVQVDNKQVVPTTFGQSNDSINSANIKWKTFFTDPYLVALIDTAIKNNYELLSTFQDIEIAKNNIRIKHGDLFPKVNAAVGLGLDKTGRHTAASAGNTSINVAENQDVPDVLGDIFLGFRASWEADIWGKLHNAKKAAVIRYLKSVEGKNFIVTNLVAEIANSYYELLALDNQLDIINQAIDLQKNQLEVLKVQKDAAVATELAVKQFEAQVYNSQSQEFDIQQKITEAENKINFLLGRFPKHIDRDKTAFTSQMPKNIQVGIPSQLLQNRPDIKQVELELQAAKLDVKIARAEFYPSVGITGIMGFNGFKPKYVLPNIENLAFSFVGDLAAPIINRNAIQAEFKNANANQISAMYDYQKTILNGYIEVYNQMSSIQNLSKYYTIKTKEAETLTASIDIAKDLFKYARANYLEVLTVQRDALSAKLELVEAKKNQLIAVTNIYRALGGGWK
jgi:NodT family efflux transporter outer membrane factor (OMF) lipoprotein